MKKILLSLILICVLALCTACGGQTAAPDSQSSAELPSESSEPVSTPEVKPPVGADEAIVGVTTIGFVDTDGPKLETIVVEYGLDMSGATVGKESYTITNYALENRSGATEQNGVPGEIVEVRAEGNFVYIDVNTDYRQIPAGMMSNMPSYDGAMYAGVTQVASVTAADGTEILPSDIQFDNYSTSESSGGSDSGTGGFDSGFVPGLGGGPGGDIDESIPPEEDPNFSGDLSQFPGGGTDGPGGNPGGGMGGPGGNLGGGMGTMGGSSTAALPGTYTIRIADDFEIHGDTRYAAAKTGDPLFVEHCYNETTGGYDDVTLPYALYVPADYDSGKEYALAIQIHDAGSLSSDPMSALVESQSATNFASDWAREIVRAQGLDGVIVVAPAIDMSMKSANDNYSVNSTVPATWALLDKLTEDYSISMDHIYGTGQSMGGMQILAMAAQRDNYFAGVWANGSQWGNNMDLEEPYTSTGFGGGSTMNCVPASTDEWYITTGEDYRNWYYIVSDDNMLITNCTGDNFATTTWTELDYLYRDLAGVEIPHQSFDPATVTNDEIEAFLSARSTDADELGFMWTTFEGGAHMATWVYSHGLHAHAAWLLSQSKATEDSREKLDLNKPFQRAATQESRPLPNDDYSYVTAQAGAGTVGYNTGWYNPEGKVSSEHGPGWTYKG